MALPWLIVLSAALVCFHKEWRPTGVVVFLSQLLYSSFRQDIEVTTGLNIGAFNALYDFTTAVALFLVPLAYRLISHFRKTHVDLTPIALLNSVNMGIILCIFVVFHSAMGMSVHWNINTVFWTEYVNFILVLNLFQLYYFSEGVKDVISQFHTGYASRDFNILGSNGNRSVGSSLVVFKEKSESYSRDTRYKQGHS